MVKGGGVALDIPDLLLECQRLVVEVQGLLDPSLLGEDPGLLVKGGGLAFMLASW